MTAVEGREFRVERRRPCGSRCSTVNRGLFSPEGFDPLDFKDVNALLEELVA
jgi:hypothetical protein